MALLTRLREMLHGDPFLMLGCLSRISFCSGANTPTEVSATKQVILSNRQLQASTRVKGVAVIFQHLGLFLIAKQQVNMMQTYGSDMELF